MIRDLRGRGQACRHAFGAHRRDVRLARQHLAPRLEILVVDARDEPAGLHAMEAPAAAALSQ